MFLIKTTVSIAVVFSYKIMYQNIYIMKTRIDYFRVVAWALAFALSIAMWVLIISAVRPTFA